jgi:NADP-dependent 3-hydroxy acid dehydrogenase YdfG
MFSLQGKVFIVTGAGGAIAQSINAALLKAGAQLALVDRNDNAQRARDHLGSGVAIAADLGSFEGAKEAIQATLEHFGRIDGAIHTVGGFVMQSILEFEPNHYDRLLDANLRTLVNFAAAVMPELQKTQGFLGGISAGQAARGAGPKAAIYTAAKGAVALFLKSLAAEVKTVRVGVLYPMGTVDTPANRHDMPNADPNTWIDPLELAESFVFMASRTAQGRVLEVQVHPPA